MIRVNAKAAAMVCAVGLGVSTASVASAGTGAGDGRSTVTSSAGHRVAAMHVIAAKHIGKRVVELTISTPAFTSPTKVDVDLPVGYHAHKHRRWPVTYFLAGIMNTYASFNHVVDGLKLTRHYRSIAVSPKGTAATGATGTTTVPSVRPSTRPSSSTS